MVRLSNIAALLAIASPLSCLAATLAEAISARDDLSTLLAIATRYPSVLGNLGTSGGTLLAPTNAALAAFLEAAGIPDLASVPESAAQDLVSYHILPTVLRSTDLVNPGGATSDTGLTAETYANLGGKPNVVFASAFGSTGVEPANTGLKIYSGVGVPANVTGADIEFDDGVIHIIDRVLNLPQLASATAVTAGLSTLVEAVTTANLVEVVDTTPQLTVFAPTNEAFAAAGVDLGALTTEQLSDVLKYHTIVGTVGYSTALQDGMEYETLLGVPVTVHIMDGQIFINKVAVAQANVMLANGVAHVISGVLTPPAAGGSGSSTSTSSSSAPGSTGTSGASSGASDNNNAALSLSSRGPLAVLAVASMTFALLL